MGRLSLNSALHLLDGRGLAAVGLPIALLSTAIPSPAQQERPPYSFDQLARLVESGLFTEQRIGALTRESCLGFELDAAAGQRLQALGASDALLDDLSEVCTRLPQHVVALRLTPGELELSPEEEGRLTAEALTPADTPAVSVTLYWVSEDTAVAWIGGPGRVIARAPGSTRIIARSDDGVEAVARVRVRALPVATEIDSGDPGRDGAGVGALGVLVPGGAQFEKGETVKGSVVLGGVLGALAAGYLIRSTQRVRTEQTVVEDCTGNTCTFEPRTVIEERSRRRLVEGAAVAAAIWLGGLAEGLLAGDAGPSDSRTPDGRRATARDVPTDRAEIVRLELLPRDALSVEADGGVLVTALRLQW